MASEKFDCKSSKVTGAQSSGRARVIWSDGLLSGFDKSGKIFSTPSEKPTRRPRYIRAWDAITPNGIVHIDETCWTCGGWLPVTLKSIDELLSENQ